MSRRTWQRRSPRLAVVVIVVGVSLVAGAVALAAGPSGIIDTFTPRSERQITNLDVLRQQIRNYYGDPAGTGVFGADSYYVKEASFAAAAGEHWLAARSHSRDHSRMKAIVLDVDDTTLNTWNYEIFSNWPSTSGRTRPLSPDSCSRPFLAWSSW